jgi:tRNA pseudouridine55 synthase
MEIIAAANYDGVLNLLKPPGMTSHDVVSFLRRQFGIKKIGHAGTLDPQAAGVLPLCLGQGTRLIEYLMNHDKEYLCEMTLGITTTTQDAWGEAVTCRDYRQVTLEMLQNALPRFVGEITQQVPSFSAVKVQGVPLYKRARQGAEITPVVRRVKIYHLEIVKFAPPKVTMFIHCGKGTYVRTICHDLGEELGVGAHLSFLLRTRVGSFSLADSLTLEEIASLQEKSLLPLEHCLQGMRKIVLEDADLRRIKTGQKVILPDKQKTVENASLITRHNPAAIHPEADVAILDKHGKIQAIASILSENKTNILKPKKVLNRD